MKKLTLLAVLGVATIAGPSFAADLRPMVKAPVVAASVPIWDWTGFYIGVHGGYGWGDADYRFNDGFGGAAFFNLFPGDRFRQRIEGGLFGGHLGYNMQFGSVVAGIEASGAWTNIGSTVTSPFFPASDVWTHQVDWLVSLTARLGFTTGPALLYVKGGGAVADIRNRLQDNVTFGGVFVESRDVTPGYTVGAGVEYAFTPNWIFGVEGNYYRFDHLSVLERLRFVGTGAIVPGGIGTDHEVATDFWTITGRISYKFGVAPAPIAARY